MNKTQRFYKDGILQKIPKKLKAKIEVFDEIAEKFEKEKKYSEKEVNEILKTIFADFVSLRRSLVDYKYLERNKDGKVYSLKEADKSE